MGVGGEGVGGVEDPVSDVLVCRMRDCLRMRCSRRKSEVATRVSMSFAVREPSRIYNPEVVASS